MATNNSTNTSNPISVDQGGTGRATSTTPYGVLCAGTTATGAQQTIASVGAAGEVLTSNGPGALPTFQAAGGGAGLLFNSFTITSTQLKAINTSPVTLIPAQGAGIVINPLIATCKFVYGGSNVFTGGSASALFLTFQGGTPSTQIGQVLVTLSIMTGTVSTYTFQGLTVTPRPAYTAATCENRDLIISALADYTGNAANDNYVVIGLYYQLLTI